MISYSDRLYPYIDEYLFSLPRSVDDVSTEDMRFSGIGGGGQHK